MSQIPRDYNGRVHCSNDKDWRRLNREHAETGRRFGEHEVSFGTWDDMSSGMKKDFW